MLGGGLKMEEQRKNVNRMKMRRDIEQGFVVLNEVSDLLDEYEECLDFMYLNAKESSREMRELKREIRRLKELLY